MKRYTGNLVLELEDVNTGVVETVSETNMVTNAVNDILGVNPMGVMYKAGGQYDDSLTWNEELLPICPNMIGGILLFPSSITEQADNLYLPSTNLPVAYASNDVNATANTKRGSMNLTESMKLSDGEHEVVGWVQVCLGVYAFSGKRHNRSSWTYFQAWWG